MEWIALGLTVVGLVLAYFSHGFVQEHVKLNPESILATANAFLFPKKKTTAQNDFFISLSDLTEEEFIELFNKRGRGGATALLYIDLFRKFRFELSMAAQEFCKYRRISHRDLIFELVVEFIGHFPTLLFNFNSLTIPLRGGNM